MVKMRKDGSGVDVQAGGRSQAKAVDQDGEGGRGSLTDNALRVLHNRYLKKDDTGQVVETPVELFRRVAQHVSSVEDDSALWNERFFSMMWDRRFMPNSPTLMNAGRPLGMLSACFVLPLEDSIADIMETARQIALVQRAGGGTGVDLSQLRPAGSIVRSSGGTTEGPLSFLKMLSSVTDAIQQGAFRRGANMGTMRVDHPDVLSFIRIKEDLSQVTNYNLSCTVPDVFMDAVKADRSGLHVVVNPHDGRKAYLRKADDRADYEAYGKSVDKSAYWTVGDVFHLIVTKAWQSGEPGLIFIDRVNEVNPTPNVGPMTSTNPCGEQPLLPYEACNLGSLNLNAFFRADVESDEVDDKIDWDGLAETVRTAVRFLDDVVEVNNYPTREIDEMCRANRKIGLGVMGWADLLFNLGIRYDGDDALLLANRMGEFIRREGWDEDSRLAEEKGTFLHWKGSRWDEVENRKMRNAHVVTIAPTGTISIIAGCSGGIEPIFSLVFKRQVMRDVSGKAVVMFEANPVFLAALEKAGYTSQQIETITEYACEHGTIDGCPVALADEVLDVFRSARDVGPEWHVRMQAAWQKHTDAAVSKTINFPHEATVEEVETAYLLAYETGCKGITVYRDGSRQNQPMALDKKRSAKQDAQRPEQTSIAQAARDEIVDMLLGES
ncbi:MAG: adenosylcobalamin-dependent ribonucleoside-diphosphate reductase [Planctomycetes bacterium]|nr:adenosylcobalamin-dependent ribonucleoside-diphosphate reductase [Planctomycetota bacterium]